MTVRYPRGAEAENDHQAAALAALVRDADARGRPRGRPAPARRAAARRHRGPTQSRPQGVYEPQLLSDSKVLGKLANRVAPASVKKHRADSQADDDQRQPDEEAHDEAA